MKIDKSWPAQMTRLEELPNHIAWEGSTAPERNIEMNKRWISKRGILKYGVPMIFGGLGLAWVTGIVLYPAENPPQRYEGVILSSQSDPVLRRACFDGEYQPPPGR